MRILTEAAGCLTSSYLINYVKKSGNICIATDAKDDCYGKYLADEFYVVPYANDPSNRGFLKKLVIDKKIDMVIPMLDDSLLTWSLMKSELRKKGIHVIVSDPDVIDMCLDKWKTFNFFKKIGIPTPDTSLTQKYKLVKPRMGRGGKGIIVTDKVVDMNGNISQEFIDGEEYTIDVLCDKKGNPIYVVPRQRLEIKEGKATAGIVVKDEKIQKYVKQICNSVEFHGPINIQCFKTKEGEILFSEINPRLGGGSILGMEATENWIRLLENFVEDKEVVASKGINYGLRMERYYEQVFF